jgi:RimJ/RimL family protein N-acetyltransferase
VDTRDDRVRERPVDGRRSDVAGPDLPILRTARLVLRPFVLADAPVVQRLAGDESVASSTLNIPHPYEDGMAERWIEKQAGEWEAGASLVLAVTTHADGLVGAVGLDLTPAHRRAELGYWIGVPFWNRGYATEASAALIAHGFEELGLNRVMARHITRNPASGRVMKKLGMRPEGVMREHIVKWDEPEDIAIYGILRSDRPDA